MAKKDFKLGTVRSKVSGTSTAFGESPTKNVAAATDAKKDGLAVDKKAAPNEGQAYVIVRTQALSSGDYPYHAATVVATDGEDRITLEVFASGTDARDDDRKAPGDFHMYSTTVEDNSFHKAWEGSFGTDPITIVVEPKS